MTSQPESQGQANVYEESFTEMGSLSDLKSVPSASATNSPIQTSESESEIENVAEIRAKKHHKWPKYKKFQDPLTGEEAVYELVSPRNNGNRKGFYTICTELITLSSISLFVASNLFAFTVGMLVGKRIAYDF